MTTASILVVPAGQFADDPPPYRVYYDDEIDVQERSMTLKKFGLEFTEQSATILLDVQGRVQHASVNKKRADRPHGQELGRLIDSLDR